jgi:hypothetical protein
MPEASRKSGLTGSCHCGAIRITLPRRPRQLTDCNCSICRRYGALWAYFLAPSVRVEHARGATEWYAWGERSLRFHRCARCGCLTHYTRAHRPDAMMGVNSRMFDAEALEGIRIRRLDGARTWKVLG